MTAEDDRLKEKLQARGQTLKNLSSAYAEIAEKKAAAKDVEKK